MNRFVLVSESVKQNAKRFIDSVDVSQKPELVCEFKQHRKKKSWEQDKYLHGVVYKIISEYTGYDIEWLHEYFKEKFLEPILIDVFGETKKIYTTKGKDTKTMSEFTENVCRYAAMEIGVYIPKPGESDDVP